MSAEIDAKDGDFISDRRQKLKAVLANQEAFMARARIPGTPLLRVIQVGTEEGVVGTRRSRRIFLNGEDVVRGFQKVINSLP